jgi:hypothetical protein
MGFISRSTKWIMVVSGLLTCTMFYAAVSPKAVQESAFGEALEGPVAQIVVRNWGILIGLVGLMLIYGAFDKSTRRLVLTVATLSKTAFVTLVLVYGQQTLGFQAGPTVVTDSIMVILFVLCLIASGGQRAT